MLPHIFLYGFPDGGNESGESQKDMDVFMEESVNAMD